MVGSKTIDVGGLVTANTLRDNYEVKLGPNVQTTPTAAVTMAYDDVCIGP